MKKILLAATVLLIIQVGLVVFTHTSSRMDLSAPPESSLLTLKAAEVTQFTITDVQGEQVRLASKEGKWVLPDIGDAPADQAAVENLLAKLEGLRQGFVVASSSEAAKRFKVEEQHFERHLTVFQGEDQVTDLYLGTAPSYREVHARRAGSDDIVAVTLASYELWSTPNQWLDKQMAAIAEENITAITSAELSLTREQTEGQGDDEQPPGWALADGTVADATAANELAHLLGNLSVISAQVNDSTPREILLTLTVTDDAGTELVYTFMREGEENPLLLRSDRELLLTLDESTLDALLQAHDTLMETPEEEAAAIVQEETTEERSTVQTADQTSPTSQQDEEVIQEKVPTN